MASVLELAVNTGKWDVGLRKAKAALDNFTQASGGLKNALDKDSEKMSKFVGMMGKTESTAKTAKGQMNDYKSAIEQLTMQYNRMSEAQQKTIGQDYLRAIDELKAKYKAVGEEVRKMNADLNGSASTSIAAPDTSKASGILGMGSKMEGALAVFGGNMMTKAVDLAGSLALKLQDAVTQGVALAEAGEGVSMAFDRLNRPDLLDDLRKATHGTVTDLELMKAAVRFKDFNLPLEELGTMLAFAQQKAKDTGQSIDYMTESIVTGLGRKSVMILDNLGISASEIKEHMASTGDMTKAVGEIIREQMSAAGDYVETTADRAKRAEVDLQNAMTELGNTLLPLKAQGTDVFTAIEVSILHMLNDAAEPAVPVLLGLGEALDDLKDIATDNWVTNGFTEWASTGLDYVTRLIPGINTLRSAIESLKQVGAEKAGVAGGANVGAVVSNVITPPKKQQNNNPNPTPVTVPVTPVITPGSEADYRAQIKKLNDALLQETTAEGREVIRTMINELQYKIQQLDGYTRIEGLGTSFTPASISGMSGYGTSAVTDRQQQLQNMHLPALNLASYGRPTTWEKNDGKDKKKDDDMKVLSDNVGKISGGINNIFSGIESMGVEIPEELRGILSGINGLMGIVSGISSILSAIAVLSATPFARGGVVRAATGYVVPGNHMSGDMVPALLNSGETVFNRAQMGVLASALEDQEKEPVSALPYVVGDKVFLGINNSLRQRGQGEIVTTQMLRRMGVI